MYKTKLGVFGVELVSRRAGMPMRLIPLAVVSLGLFVPVSSMGQSALVSDGDWAPIVLKSPSFISQLIPAASDRRAASAAAPVTLKFLLAEAAATHPSLLAARLESKAAQQDIETTSRQRWPTVSAVVESGPSSVSSVPSRVLRLDQTLWDGGRVSALIAQAESQANNSAVRVAAQRQQLFIQTVAAWQSLQSSDSRIRIAQRTLIVMNGYKATSVRLIQG
jgi:hypothetical protein